MIALDASVLIAHLNAEDAHHERAKWLLSTGAGDELIANTITVAEVLAAPAGRGHLGRALGALRRLGVDERPLPPDAAPRLAQLRWSSRLRLPDCCLLLTAQDAGASVASFDDRLLRVARDLGLPVVQ